MFKAKQLKFKYFGVSNYVLRLFSEKFWVYVRESHYLRKNSYNADEWLLVILNILTSIK